MDCMVCDYRGVLRVMIEINTSGSEDVPIGSYLKNEFTGDWYVKQYVQQNYPYRPKMEWHWVGNYTNLTSPLYQSLCTTKCLKIEEDMAFWNDDNIKGLSEMVDKFSNDITKQLKEEVEKLKSRNKDLERSIDNYRGAQDLNSKLADARIADMDVLEEKYRKLDECYNSLHAENRGLKEELKVMKNKHLMAYNLGLARLKRIGQLELNGEGVALRKIETLENVNEHLRKRVLEQEVELNTRLKDIHKLEEKIKTWNLPETVKTWNIQLDESFVEIQEQAGYIETLENELEIRQVCTDLEHDAAMNYKRTCVESCKKVAEDRWKKNIELDQQVMRYHQTVEAKDKEINKFKQDMFDVKLCWVCGRSYNRLKEHDCNLNKEIANKSKLIDDLKSQLKQLGAKYKNLQKVQSDLVERNKRLAYSFVGQKIRDDRICYRCRKNCSDDNECVNNQLKFYK